MRLLTFSILMVLASCRTPYIVPKQIKEEIPLYNLAPNDTLVDIGCGDGFHDLTIAHYHPNTFLVLEDLPYGSKHLNIKRQIKFLFKNTTYTPQVKQHHRLVLGTPDAIPLASSTYKKVLCRKTLHEFRNKEKMAKEMERILDKGGTLIIVEPEPRYVGELDPHCKMRYLTSAEIIQLFSSLQCIEKNVIAYRHGSLNVFTFIK
jgi:ubiquinone/menaquinone biosynthesis C-methylase UbiE